MAVRPATAPTTPPPLTIDGDARAHLAACAAFTAQASADRSAMTSNEAALPRAAEEASEPGGEPAAFGEGES